MVLYGWWYLAGFAILVLAQLLYIGPSESRHWKRRIRLVQERMRRKDEERKAHEATQRRLDIEKHARRRYRPIRVSFFRPTRR